MDNAKLNVVRFDESDVIATSIRLTINGLGDGIKGNANFVAKSWCEKDIATWTNVWNEDKTGVINFFSGLDIGLDSTSAVQIQNYVEGAPDANIYAMICTTKSGDAYGDNTSTSATWANVNGLYIWNGSKFIKQ